MAVVSFRVMTWGAEGKVEMTHLANPLVPVVLLVVIRLKTVFAVVVAAGRKSPFSVLHIRRVFCTA